MSTNTYPVLNILGKEEHTQKTEKVFVERIPHKVFGQIGVKRLHEKPHLQFDFKDVYKCSFVKPRGEKNGFH